MRQTVLILMFPLSLCMALEYSARIQALGAKFAYLIPDYETDLYLNPDLLGEKRMTVGYEPATELPLTFRALRSRFAYGGEVGGSLLHGRDGSNERTEIGVTYRDFWYVDLRGMLPRFLASDVWNIFDDVGIAKGASRWPSGEYDSTADFKYFGTVKEAMELGKRWNLIYQVGAGLYDHMRSAASAEFWERYDQWILISSGRVGLHYRDAPGGDKFTSLYVDIGGPVSRAEIDALPYTIFLSVPRSDGFSQRLLAHALTPKIGFASSMPLDHGFLAVGVYDRAVLQRTEDFEGNLPLLAVTNELAFPAALEWTFGRLILRAGTGIAYQAYLTRRGRDRSAVVDTWHRLVLNKSFGLGWQPADNLAIDLVNTGDLSSVGAWAITLKFEH